MAHPVSPGTPTLQGVGAAGFIPFLWRCARWDTSAWFLEIAVDLGSGPKQSVYLEEPSADEIAEVLLWANEQEFSLYFGALPRTEIPTEASGQCTPFGYLKVRSDASKATRGEAPFAWLDLDPPEASKTDPDAHRRWRKQRAEDLLGMDVAPSVIVSSGRGIHAYWMIRDDQGEGPMACFAVRCSEGLAKALGGDPAVAKEHALMRMPGSWNRKAEPIPVEVVHVGDPVTMAQMQPYGDLGLKTLPRVERRKAALPDRRTEFCERCRKKVNAWPPADGAVKSLFLFTLACASHGMDEEEALELALGQVGPEMSRPNTTEPVVSTSIARVYRRVMEGGLSPFGCEARPRVVEGDDYHQEPLPTGREVTLAEGRRVIHEVVTGFIGRERSRSMLVAAPTGLGKTHALVRMLPKGPPPGLKRIVYCAPTRKGVDDALRPLRKVIPCGPTRKLFGRRKEQGAFHCPRKAELDRFASKRRKLRLVCQRCPLRNSCPWMASFRRFMRCGTGAATQDAVAANPAILKDALVIVDEKLTGMLLRRVEITSVDLRRYAEAAASHGRLGEILADLARRIALAVEKRDEEPWQNLLSSEDQQWMELAIAFGEAVPFPFEEDLPANPDDCVPALTEILVEVCRYWTTNSANLPLRVERDAALISVPNEPMLAAVREGRVLAADATAPADLVQELGFDCEEISLHEPPNVEVIGVAGKTYGKGSSEEIVRILERFLALPGTGVVCRRAEASNLREKLPEAAGRILHYGAHRGSNAFLELGICNLLVVRWMKNPAALRHEAKEWATLLGSDDVVPDVDLSGEGLGFAGTSWMRKGAGMPSHSVLRAVVEQDRKEVLQAIGRLRPHEQNELYLRELSVDGYEPDEDDLDSMQVYILDGFPVPGLKYDELLATEDGSVGSEAELYEHIAGAYRHLPEESGRLLEAAKALKEKRGSSRKKQMAGVARVNAERGEAACLAHMMTGLEVSRLERQSPGITNKKIMAELHLSEWDLRCARAAMKEMRG